MSDTYEMKSLFDKAGNELGTYDTSSGALHVNDFDAKDSVDFDIARDLVEWVLSCIGEAKK
jgi:hypothetical protein